jgi:GNAT superfamily N-acetyltransferase
MPNRYPQEAALQDGRRVMIRPFNRRDADALFAFFQHLPANVRRFAWDRIDDRALIDQWTQNIDYAKVFPLLAVDGTRIVADATLHHRDGGPLRLVGRVKWLIDPEFRDVGLGTVLVNHLIGAARTDGLRHLSCMLISELEADAVTTLEKMGFTSYTDKGYGVDPDGNPHDMTKLVLEL